MIGRIYHWWFPDSFVGSDPTAQRNAWLGFFLVIYIIAVLLILMAAAQAGTVILLMYGWGDNAFGSSSGINTIASRAARIPNVTKTQIFNYWQTQDVANAAMAAGGQSVVLVGYSCGANSASTIAAGLNGHRKVTIATIQPSVWCGGYPLGSAVNYAQETYAGCLLTLGFGCLVYTIGPGFTGHFLKIKRPDLHPLADQDPDAQNDVLTAIATVANPQLKKAFLAHLARGRTTEIVRYHGQRP